MLKTRRSGFASSPRAIKVVNINTFAEGLNEQKKESGMRRGSDKAFLKTNAESLKLNSQERGQIASSPYLTSLSRMSFTSEKKRERTVSNGENLFNNRLELKEFNEENDTRESERGRERHEERHMTPSRFQTERKSSELSKEKLMRKTKHSMFRVVKKADYISMKEAKKSKVRTSSL